MDAKSLYDLLANETSGGADRRTALDVQVLREELRALSGRGRWIDHLHMPADGLTKKQGKTGPLLSMLESGKFGITKESVTLGDRLHDRKETGYNRRWAFGQQNFLGTEKQTPKLTKSLCIRRACADLSGAFEDLLFSHTGLSGTNHGLRWASPCCQNSFELSLLPLKSSLSTPHNTLHSTLYTLHSTLYILHFTLHTLHSTLYTLNSTLHTTLSARYTIHSHFTPYTSLFTLYSPHTALYTLHSTLYSLHFKLHALHLHSHSTLYTPHTRL